MLCYQSLFSLKGFLLKNSEKSFYISRRLNYLVTDEKD